MSHQEPTPTPGEAGRAAQATRRNVLIAVGLTAVVAVILIVSSIQQRQQEERDVDDLVRALTPRTVVYEVLGSAESVSITAETPTGTSQADNRAVPLRDADNSEFGLSFDFQRGDFVYIAAQNEGKTGTVTCRIKVDGEVVSENTAEGAFSIATCKGSA